MKINALSNPFSRSRGVTLVEILLVVAVLVILLSFAMPSVGNATARAELKAAAENVQYSMDAARNLARMTESSVAVNIETASQPEATAGAESGSGGEPQRITFSKPEIQDYLLPVGIRLVSDHDHYVFDSRGLVLEPGRVTLLSATDESISSAIDIK
jgi:prepilin-type N-terminal cleavage/methylation domain-containing protein